MCGYCVEISREIDDLKTLVKDEGTEASFCKLLVTSRGTYSANIWRLRGMAESMCAGVNRRLTAPPQTLIN